MQVTVHRIGICGIKPIIIGLLSKGRSGMVQQKIIERGHGCIVILRMVILLGYLIILTFEFYPKFRHDLISFLQVLGLRKAVEEGLHLIKGLLGFCLIQTVSGRKEVIALCSFIGSLFQSFTIGIGFRKAFKLVTR